MYIERILTYINTMRYDLPKKLKKIIKGKLIYVY